MCDCLEWLKAAAMNELVAADRAARDKRLRIHEPLLRRRAHGLNWAAGELLTHQRKQQDPTWTPTANESATQQQLLEQMALDI